MCSVGSSSLRRRSPVAIFSSSPFAFGVTAKLITGEGKSMCGGSTGTSWSTSTSPVTTSFSFATAPRSPTPSASDGSFSLPCSSRIWPSRSFACVRGSTSVVSPVTGPARTRKQLIRPVNGSAIVLKMNTACFASPNSIVVPLRAGDGTPSTSRSSSAVVPRFFVATPQPTG